MNTISGREIHYYGENKNKELDILFEKLLSCWDTDTVSPGCFPYYKHESDPSKGQCTITAMLVQDLFGGTIREVKVGVGTHSFNEINGEYYDLASDQFIVMNIPLNYDENSIVNRENLNGNENVFKRYSLLKEKVEKM